MPPPLDARRLVLFFGLLIEQRTTSMPEDKTTHQTLLEYGFRWFEFHAQQRTTTFNFYLIIYAGLAAVASFLFKENIHLGLSVISVILIFISVLFWQLDVRNRQLIQIGESILSDAWIKNGLGESLNPVALSAVRQPIGFRFREIFQAVFALGGIGGIVAFGYAIYRAQV
jgi:hypothetical protein